MPPARRLDTAAMAVLAMLAGLLQAVSIAAPWNGQPQWWLQVASLAVLVWQLQRAPLPARRWAAFFTGWLYATTWLTGTFWWLFISMHTYGGMPAPLAAVAVLALAAALSLYYALACAAFVAFAPANGVLRAVLFASLWLTAELLRGHWFTGFPWGAGGYAHVDGPLAALAPWVGVYGIGAVACLLAFALASLLQTVMARTWPALRGTGVWGAAFALAVLVLLGMRPGPTGDASPSGADAASAGRIQVALLQGNIPQDEKFQPGSGVPLALAWYAGQLVAATAPLVITPETALPMLPQYLPPGYLAGIAASFVAPSASSPRAALVGLPLGSVSEGYANSVIGLKPAQDGAPSANAPYRYDKHHLVPFGEFVPPMFRWFTDLMQIPLGDFSRGGTQQPPFEWQGQRLMPNICYEDLFGEEIAAHFGDGLAEPTILVNISNIGWFGDTIAVDQHLQISRMRSLEFARPMLRATNTGATAIIDHRGVVQSMLPRYTRGALVGEVEGRSGRTPYAAWAARFGLWPLWVIGLLPVAVLALLRRRSVQRGR